MTAGPHQWQRLIVCGGADAGKSSLIDRLVHESKVAENQLAADGRLAEPDHRGSIDGAPRYFSTGARGFLVADTPGADQYTRHMIAASAADFAVVLVDGLQGMSTQTRRHSYLVSLLRIHHVVVVNKMDLVGYSKDACASIEGAYREFASRIGLTDVTCIPVCAVQGDNVGETSNRMRWYTGHTLMQHLEHLPVGNDSSRGDVLAASDAPPAVADQFEATIVWMHERPMLQGRSYRLKIGAQTVDATVAPLKYSINVDTLEHLAAKKLELNDIGVCEIELSRPVVFEPYAENRDLGGFVLIDRITNATVGAGMLHFALRRSDNVQWQALDVKKSARAELKGQTPCVVWFTGLSGAGKSTVGNVLEKRLHALGRHTYLLDGDNVRRGLNKDLGFTDADRVENVRRVAEVAHLMADAGLIVLVSLISPFRAERRMARGLMGEGEFFEVFVDTPLQVAEERDPKGLYKKARRGELKNFTGVDSPYEVPEAPEIRIDTTRLAPEQAADFILEHLRRAGIVAVL